MGPWTSRTPNRTRHTCKNKTNKHGRDVFKVIKDEQELKDLQKNKGVGGKDWVGSGIEEKKN
jgi:hypothetical protein